MTLMTLQIRLIQIECIGFSLLICPSTFCHQFNIELDPNFLDVQEFLRDAYSLEVKACGELGCENFTELADTVTFHCNIACTVTFRPQRETDRSRGGSRHRVSSGKSRAANIRTANTPTATTPTRTPSRMDTSTGRIQRRTSTCGMSG